MGMKLRNPIIVGSCSLTSNLEDIVKLEQYGAGAIVLKSIFEEEILNQSDGISSRKIINHTSDSHISAPLDYIDSYSSGNKLNNYLQLIKSIKKKVAIPIIASINCLSDKEWIGFTTKIQKAGADAIELNISLSPMAIDEQEHEKTIQKIVGKVIKHVSIPVSVKLGECYTNLSSTIVNISSTDISALVLFSKFYSSDIDIYNFSIVPGRMQSCEYDYAHSLRWIALLSDKVKCNIAASTGIHDGNTVIKQILAGADAVQVVSSLYLYGKKHIEKMLTEIEEWMFEKGMFSINQFRGKASYKKNTDPAVYERIQYMKQYGRIGLLEKMQ
jgi:dihydroorotate dehydrogenase (fumarate)